MTDRRTVDGLTIEEIEELLLIKRRALRHERLRRLEKMGRVVDDPPLSAMDNQEAQPAPVAAGKLASDRSGSSGIRSRFWSVEYDDSERLGENSGTTRSQSSRPEPGRFASFRDRLLLGLEVVALVGLVAILVGSLANLKVLNEEVAQAREAPTPTATPLIQVSILPGGSSPLSGADDIPMAYRNLVRPMPSMQVPTPGPQQASRIVIPSIHVDAPVMQGDSWEDLKKGAGHHIGSSHPGERGNVVISAHNDVFGEIFRRLEDVELEDKITVYTGSQTFNYLVRAKRIVEPTDVSVMAPTSRPVLTLITCYPYLIDTHRLVVIAELER
jgi:sortase A